jgi:hypothetical protein
VFVAAGSGGESAGSYSFGATMHVAPNMTVYSPSTGTAGHVYNVSTSADITGMVVLSVSLVGFGGIGGTNYVAGDIYRFMFAASAEL